MPVAHADVDRERMAERFQPGLKSIRLAAGDLGDGRDATEELVVMGHLLYPLLGHTAAAENVVEEGADVVGTLGTAERDDEHGIEDRHDFRG